MVKDWRCMTVESVMSAGCEAISTLAQFVLSTGVQARKHFG